MFGNSAQELLGANIDRLVPDRFRAAHGQHREGFMAAPRARLMGDGLELYGRRKDGTEFPVDVRLNPIESPGGLLAATLARWLMPGAKSSTPGNAPEAEKEPIDLRALTEGAFASEGPEFLPNLIGVILRDMDSRLNNMRLAVRSADSSQLAGEAHVLKGSCGHFGAARLMSQCAALEKKSKEGALVKQLLAELEREAGRVRQALERLLKSAPASPDRVDENP